MHIIGIEIGEGCNSDIIKNLRPDWYPFGDYNKPTKENGYKWRNGSLLSDRLYQIHPDMSQISISCIIGMNGSGKTTLFDVLFRLINNFTSFIDLGKEFDRYAIEYVKGLNAKLYFDVEGKIGYIENHDDTTKLFFMTNGDGNINNIDRNRFSEISKELFYTIGINYSLYSMDFRDDDGIHKGKNQWMCNIFNNEAEYAVPLTFSPYRIDGQIDVRRDEYLAKRRLISLSLLLLSQGKELLKGYNPQKITYTFNINNIKNLEDAVDSLANRRNVSASIRRIKQLFGEKWKRIIKIEESKYADKSNEIYDYMAFESARICLTYKSYRDLFGLGSIINAEDRNEKDPANKGHYEEIIKIISENNCSSITSDIHQVLAFLSKHNYELNSGSEQIDSFISKNLPINKKVFETYDEIYAILPPAFYDVDIIFTKEDSGKQILLSQFSSGEKQLLYSHSAILYHIYNIANAKDSKGEVPYKHINIVIDEVELYSHPEYQRTYISKFVDMLAGLHIDKTVIRSINLMIATHSPFIISDIPIENTLCLDNGYRKKLYNETYCANIYDLLKQSFFLEYPMGEVARRLMNEIVLVYNDHNVNSSLKDKIQDNASFFQYIGRTIADPIIKNSINTMIQSIIEEKKNGLSDLLNQKDQLKKQLSDIEEQISNMYAKD